MLEKLRRYTRGQRRKLFEEFLAISNHPMKIVDLGGTVTFWTDWGLSERPMLDITLVNNHEVDTVHADDAINLPNIRRIDADVLTLKIEDLRSYDLIFSNSLIEHLPGAAAQAKLASVITESEMPYFVQTPNKMSPVDPHYPRPYVPFFGAYPRGLQARLLTVSGLGSGSREVTYESAMHRLDYYYPLSKNDVCNLFPNAAVTKERVLGVPMSIIARWKPGQQTYR